MNEVRRNNSKTPSPLRAGPRRRLSLRMVIACALTTAAIGASAALADDIDQYIDNRISNYREMGAAFKAVNDQLKTPAPNISTIRQSSKIISNVGAHQYSWFKPGSGPESGAKTKALPAIWDTPEKFKAAQDAFRAQADLFAAAAASGDPKRITASAKTLGAACSACHRSFRRDD
jgi:cytochrome c556